MHYSGARSWHRQILQMQDYNNSQQAVHIKCIGVGTKVPLSHCVKHTVASLIITIYHSIVLKTEIMEDHTFTYKVPLYLEQSCDKQGDR